LLKVQSEWISSWNLQLMKEKKNGRHSKKKKKKKRKRKKNWSTGKRAENGSWEPGTREKK
jgi:hypothetical protein